MWLVQGSFRNLHPAALALHDRWWDLHHGNRRREKERTNRRTRHDMVNKKPFGVFACLVRSMTVAVASPWDVNYLNQSTSMYLPEAPGFTINGSSSAFPSTSLYANPLGPYPSSYDHVDDHLQGGDHFRELRHSRNASSSLNFVAPTQASGGVLVRHQEPPGRTTSKGATTSSPEQSLSHRPAQKTSLRWQQHEALLVQEAAARRVQEQGTRQGAPSTRTREHMTLNTTTIPSQSRMKYNIGGGVSRKKRHAAGGVATADNQRMSAGLGSLGNVNFEQEQRVVRDRQVDTAGEDGVVPHAHPNVVDEDEQPQKGHLSAPEEAVHRRRKRAPTSKKKLTVRAFLAEAASEERKSRQEEGEERFAQVTKGQGGQEVDAPLPDEVQEGTASDEANAATEETQDVAQEDFYARRNSTKLPVEGLDVDSEEDAKAKPRDEGRTVVVDRELEYEVREIGLALRDKVPKSSSRQQMLYLLRFLYQNAKDGVPRYREMALRYAELTSRAHIPYQEDYHVVGEIESGMSGAVIKVRAKNKDTPPFWERTKVGRREGRSSSKYYTTVMGRGVGNGQEEGQVSDECTTMHTGSGEEVLEKEQGVVVGVGHVVDIADERMRVGFEKEEETVSKFRPLLVQQEQPREKGSLHLVQQQGQQHQQRENEKEIMDDGFRTMNMLKASSSYMMVPEGTTSATAKATSSDRRSCVLTTDKKGSTLTTTDKCTTEKVEQKVGTLSLGCSSTATSLQMRSQGVGLQQHLLLDENYMANGSNLGHQAQPLESSSSSTSSQAQVNNLPHPTGKTVLPTTRTTIATPTGTTIATPTGTTIATPTGTTIATPTGTTVPTSTSSPSTALSDKQAASWSMLSSFFMSRFHWKQQEEQVGGAGRTSGASSGRTQQKDDELPTPGATATTLKSPAFHQDVRRIDGDEDVLASSRESTKGAACCGGSFDIARECKKESKGKDTRDDSAGGDPIKEYVVEEQGNTDARAAGGSQQSTQEQGGEEKERLYAMKTLTVPIPSMLCFQWEDRSTQERIAVDPRTKWPVWAVNSFHRLFWTETLSNLLIDTSPELRGRVPRLVDIRASRGGKVHLLFELCSGGEIITSMKLPKLPEKDVKALARSLLQTLRVMHDDLHLIHRDVKPENLVFQDKEKKYDKVNLIDFGLTCPNTKRAHGSAGTPDYLSPQQLCFSPEFVHLQKLVSAPARRFQGDNIEAYDSDEEPPGYGSKCDLWGVGIVLFQLLEGRGPFERFFGYYQCPYEENLRKGMEPAHPITVLTNRCRRLYQFWLERERIRLEEVRAEMLDAVCLDEKDVGEGADVDADTFSVSTGVGQLRLSCDGEAHGEEDDEGKTKLLACLRKEKRAKLTKAARQQARRDVEAYAQQIFDSQQMDDENSSDESRTVEDLAKSQSKDPASSATSSSVVGFLACPVFSTGLPQGSGGQQGQHPSGSMSQNKVEDPHQHEEQRHDIKKQQMNPPSSTSSGQIGGFFRAGWGSGEMEEEPKRGAPKKRGNELKMGKIREKEQGNSAKSMPKARGVLLSQELTTQKTMCCAMEHFLCGGKRLPGPYQRASAAAQDFLESLLAPREKDRPTAAEALQHPWLQGGGF
ncbi:unnamed protein product [Amoebophrya sp. A25]|nr:unnamed protein product [Amoebophrya sp. A25]|eukprot:GSA25T00021325001.1